MIHRLLQRKESKLSFWFRKINYYSNNGGRWGCENVSSLGEVGGVGMLGGRRGRGRLLAAYLSIVAIFFFFWNLISWGVHRESTSALKKRKTRTLTYWFHAHGKGPEPISERTQHSYCLLGLWSPLIWKFNYFITRSGAAFWQSTVAPCQLHQCGGPEAPDSGREAFQTLTCFWGGTRLPKCVAFKAWKLI